MGKVNLKFLALVPLLLFFLLAVSGCGGLTVLNFDTVSKNPDSVYSQSESPLITVISSKPSAVPGISLEDQRLLDDIDYSQDIVLVILFGYGASRDDSVINVWQLKEVIWVQAVFLTPPADAVKTSPYQIIKISKAQMPRFGKLTFRLLDDDMQEKAKAVQVVSSVSR